MSRPERGPIIGPVSIQRDYASILHDLKRQTRNADRPTRMQAVVDRLWEALAPTGVSWVGFYTRPTPDADELILAVCRNKPACSPIGLHGACGRALLERCVLIVRDVTRLGEHYIACDPRDRSEIVLPCIDESDTCWGVLDLDSHQTDAFNASDARELHRVLVSAGLTREPMPPVTVV